MRDSHRGRPLPAAVDTFPVDETPYGVRGMAGNMLDWCADPYAKDGPETPAGQVVAPEVRLESDLSAKRRAVRGGDWDGGPGLCRSAHRLGNVPSARLAILGLRVARSLGPG